MFIDNKRECLYTEYYITGDFLSYQLHISHHKDELVNDAFKYI